MPHNGKPFATITVELRMVCTIDRPNRKFTYFLCLHGAHESGIRFLLRTTLNWPSGECPVLEGVVEGGVGVIVAPIPTVFDEVTVLILSNLPLIHEPPAGIVHVAQENNATQLL
jgi:hypothetical protein